MPIPGPGWQVSAWKKIHQIPDTNVLHKYCFHHPRSPENSDWDSRHNCVSIGHRMRSGLCERQSDKGGQRAAQGEGRTRKRSGGRCGGGPIVRWGGGERSHIRRSIKVASPSPGPFPMIPWGYVWCVGRGSCVWLIRNLASPLLTHGGWRCPGFSLNICSWFEGWSLTTFIRFRQL